jgi:hypothetical protein
MSQINVNPGGPPVREDAGDRTAAAGINFMAMLLVLLVVVAVLWFVFSGSLGSLFRSGNVDVNINTPSNPPAQTQPAAPAAPSVPDVAKPAQGAPSSKP